MVAKLKKYSFVVYMLLDAVLITLCFLSVNFAFYKGLNDVENISAVSLVFYILVHIVLCALGGQYSHLWQYSGIKEYIKFYIFSLMTGAIYVVVNFAVKRELTAFMMSMFTVLGAVNCIMLSRIVARFMLKEKREYNTPKVRLAVIGGGSTASSLLNNMECAKQAIYEPVAIFDDDENKQGKSINGIKIVGPISMAPAYCREHEIADILIAIPSAGDATKKRILDILTTDRFKLSMIPSVEDIIDQSGQGYWKAVREVRVEDLLGREVIKIEDPTVKGYVSGKTVLVTGGGGSIGSELCRQIAAARPEKLVIFDIYENNAYEIQQELLRKYHDTLDLSVEIGSVRDREKVDYIFQKYRPNLVYHAAAHKHVPLMETNPEEAIKNNIFGTYNVVMAANKYEAEKFTLISSDKAVNPTNCMGATKRFCEMIVQSMREISKTQYVAVRFGNVLGSNGSVVPLFKKQIAAGGPVTVTHKDMIRYFMTIPEAVQLVLITACHAENGNVYVLDMGEPVRIDDFARKMINLSGYTPDVDIKIEYTGLRPGEKLYEELLIDTKTSVKTGHDKIFVEPLPAISVRAVEHGLQTLSDAVKNNESAEAVLGLLSTVETFNHNGVQNKFALAKANLNLLPEKSIAQKTKVYIASAKPGQASAL